MEFSKLYGSKNLHFFEFVPVSCNRLSISSRSDSCIRLQTLQIRAGLSSSRSLVNTFLICELPKTDLLLVMRISSNPYLLFSIFVTE